MAAAPDASPFDEGGALVFKGLLDNPRVAADLTLEQSVKLFEGIEFWHGTRQASMTFKFADFESQVQDSYDFVEGLDPGLKAELAAAGLDREELATINGWTRDFCFIITTLWRNTERSAATLDPTLPFMRTFMRALHKLPARFVVQSDIWRADGGVRPNWDQKVQCGRVLEFFTPTSFSTDPATLRKFFDFKGPRTATYIKQGVGYDLRELSAYPKESEILLEGVARLRIDKTEKFDSSHELVKMGQIYEGLHKVEGTQEAGIECMANSPVQALLQSQKEEKKKKEDVALPRASMPALPVNLTWDPENLPGVAELLENNTVLTKGNDYAPVLASRSFSSGRHSWSVQVSDLECAIMGVALGSVAGSGRGLSWLKNAWTFAVDEPEGNCRQVPNMEGEGRLSFVLDSDEGTLQVWHDGEELVDLTFEGLQGKVLYPVASCSDGQDLRFVQGGQ